MLRDRKTLEQFIIGISCTVCSFDQMDTARLVARFVVKTVLVIAGGIPRHQWDIYIDGLCIQSKKPE